ncbi:ABC transporter substrate-binding protein [Microvirga alba]|uniref:Twin-arginine translocation signal domain-containing protein n=1 Tax=Microvirga alba TaxID=2791025 RepID=A0A931BQM1_9HYPH|nr:ABC transporter substrate-binding protein [Microvirga alba]MBF9235677.1 twin-arginine translocation signal domain-containing protein [Microvirga alba]
MTNELSSPAIHRRAFLKYGAAATAAVGAGTWSPFVIAADERALVVAINSAPKFLNPNYLFDGACYYVTSNLFSKLVDYMADGSVAGDLAERWEVSEDALTYTFHLHKGVKWTDGRPVTAKDVVWTIKSIQAEKGYGNAALAGIVDVAAVDDHTVCIVLAERNSSFLAQMAQRYGYVILPAHIYEGTDPRANPANLKPVGSGPYVLTSFGPGDHIQLDVNPDYFRGAPQVKRIFFKFYPEYSAAVAEIRAGGLDLMLSSPPLSAMRQLQKTEGVSVDIVNSQPELMVWVGFNYRNKILADVRVRRAIAHAINRSQINQIVYGGTNKAAETAYLSTSPVWNSDAKQPGFDIAKANSLLDEAGYPRQNGRTRFKIRYTGFNAATGGAQQIGEVMKQQLAQVGIELTLETFDFGVFAEKILQKRDFDLTWSAGPHGPDPQLFSNFVASKGGRNCMDFSNPEVDRLFVEARQAPDMNVAKQKYQRIQHIVAEELPRLSLIEWRMPMIYSNRFSHYWWQADSDKVPNDCYRLVKPV